MPSPIFQKHTSCHYFESLNELDARYSGLSIGNAQNKRELSDELECCLDIFLIKNNAGKSTITSAAALQAQVEEHLLLFMEESLFSYLKVMADNNQWNPNECKFQDFRFKNINAQELNILLQKDKQHCVKEVFLAISKGTI